MPQGVGYPTLEEDMLAQTAPLTQGIINEAAPAPGDRQVNCSS